MELANAEVLPLDHVDTAQEVQSVLGALHEKAGGHLDLAPATDAAGRFLAAATSLRAASAQARGPAARAVNDALMRLSRILNPVIYSSSGRFHHDPAEWSPIMRATGQHTLAALQKAGGLPALAGQPEYGFLRAQLVRERNRLVTALREAARLAGDTVAKLPAKA
jgi:hypothetical protein